MLLRAYPRISDFINDVLGTDISLPIQSFGFFVAIAFVVAAFLLTKEMQRKEKQGLLKSFTKKVQIGLPATPSQLVTYGIIGFIAGFKLLAVVLNYSACTANPQEFLFSFNGNLLGGIAGGVIGVWLKYREKQKARLDKPKWEKVEVYPHQLIGDIVVIAAVGGFIGAKIFNFLEVPEDFTRFLEDPASNLFSGLTIYGGLIVGGGAAYYYTRKKGIPFIHLIDAAAPGLMLAYGIGRIGCHVAGDGDWGIANTADKPAWLSWLPDNLWANDYANNILNEGEIMTDCVGEHCYHLVPPVFPTPIYETFMAILIFSFLWFIRKRITIPGMMLAFYLLLNGIERFFIEKIRVNVKYDIMGMKITQAEIISSLFVLAAVLLFIYLNRKSTTGKKANPTNS